MLRHVKCQKILRDKKEKKKIKHLNRLIPPQHVPEPRYDVKNYSRFYELLVICRNNEVPLQCARNTIINSSPQGHSDV